MPNPHLQVNKDFEDLGRRISRLLRQSFGGEDTSWVDLAETMLAPFEAYETGYDFDKLDGVLTRAWRSGKPTSHEAFNDAYRATFPYTDEFVSTASVRHLLIGMAEEIHAAASDMSLSPAELQLLRNVASRLFHGLSRIRFPTRYMGNNFADGSAFGLHPVAPQHQHAMGTAVRGNGAAAFHSSFDLRRRIHVLNAMNAMLAANPASVSAVFKKAVCEAIRHSTRRISASLQAMNQIVTLDPATKSFMDSWRQTLKDFAAAGGIPVTQRIPAQGKDPTRDYDLGASTDSLSYERREEDSDAEDDALLSAEDDIDLSDLVSLLGDSDEVWDEDPPDEAEFDDQMEVDDDEFYGMLEEASQPSFASVSQAVPQAWRDIDFMNDGRNGRYGEELDSSGMEDMALDNHESIMDQADAPSFSDNYLNTNGEEIGDWPDVSNLSAPSMPSMEAEAEEAMEAM